MRIRLKAKLGASKARNQNNILLAHSAWCTSPLEAHEVCLFDQKPDNARVLRAALVAVVGIIRHAGGFMRQDHQIELRAAERVLEHTKESA